MKMFFNLLNPEPKIENFSSKDLWAKAHRNWKCQKEGWTYSTYKQFCENLLEVNGGGI
jgi:hypothetical protein